MLFGKPKYGTFFGKYGFLWKIKSHVVWNLGKLRNTLMYYFRGRRHFRYLSMPEYKSSVGPVYNSNDIPHLKEVRKRIGLK